MIRRALAAATALACAAAHPPLDEARLAASYFGDDAPWFASNIPFFEASDKTLEQVYYYRWQVLRAHQRDLGALGYITTEFLDDVSWQRQPYASLNDVAAFHLYEARWLRERRYADDYIIYLYAHGGNDRHFSESIADAVWARYLADGDRAAAIRHLPGMRRTYDAWEDHFDAAKGLYWITPIDDATEYSIASIDASGGEDGFRGGAAFRPTINSYMFANARAISRLSALAGDPAAALDYAARAEALRMRVERDLWNPRLDHFTDRYQVSNQHVRYWQPVRGRELAGFVPWAFGLPRSGQFDAAWKRLLSTDGFNGRAGLRTVEPGYEHYMRQYRYDAATGAPECQWNGPVWPFQVTQVLRAMANLLNAPRSPVSAADYGAVLTGYAQLHRSPTGLDLQEDYHPETGQPIVGLARSHHYNHSGFDDLVITGLAGLRPRADAVLEVNPLVSRQLRYFALQAVPYHGRLVTIVYDRDGHRYHLGRGLSVFADGHLLARRSEPTRVMVPFTSVAPAPIRRPIDLVARIARTGFPQPSASNGASADELHGAIDGRMWFFPEAANGWSAAASAWLAVDLGSAQTIASAELAFFADGKRFAGPRSYQVELWTGADWIIPAALQQAAPASNGLTTARWRPVTASRIRVRVEPQAGRSVRLVELKAFAPEQERP